MVLVVFGTVLAVVFVAAALYVTFAPSRRHQRRTKVSGGSENAWQAASRTGAQRQNQSF